MLDYVNKRRIKLYKIWYSANLYILSAKEISFAFLLHNVSGRRIVNTIYEHLVLLPSFFFQNINQKLPACWADEFLSWYYRDDTFVKKILNSFNAKFDNESINFILLVWLMSYWITHNDTTELYKLQLWIEIYLDIVHHIS